MKQIIFIYFLLLAGCTVEVESEFLFCREVGKGVPFETRVQEGAFYPEVCNESAQELSEDCGFPIGCTHIEDSERCLCIGVKQDGK